MKLHRAPSSWMGAIVLVGSIAVCAAAWAVPARPPAAVVGARSQLPVLRQEMAAVDSELVEANAASDQLEGGLIKLTIEQRIEILKVTRALLQQRIVAIETGAPATTRVSVFRPDSGRAASLGEEIATVRRQIKDKQTESADYSGGLIKLTIEQNIATLGVSLSTLEMERLRARYGIDWPVMAGAASAAAPEHGNANVGAARPRAAARPTSTDRATSIMVPTLSNKRFQSSDFEAHVYQDAIWFDVNWSASGLTKPARAVKGTLLIGDLFGEPKVKVGWTINTPVSPGETFDEKGMGFDYNQFKNEHQWMRSTDLTDMTAKFRVESILYQDGTREDF